MGNRGVNRRYVLKCILKVWAWVVRVGGPCDFIKSREFLGQLGDCRVLKDFVSLGGGGALWNCGRERAYRSALR